jgi:adenylate cyclase
VKAVTTGGTFRFAGFALDTDKGLLSRDGKAVELRPKSYALLDFMARNAGRVLSKDELLDAVWNDVTVTEDSLTQCIRDIRLALGSAGQSLIRTLPRRGYIFESGGATEAYADSPVAEPARSKLAVLPFRNLGGGPDQAYIAAGITEDIITALARFSALTISGHHAVSSPGIAEMELQQAANKLGVNYVVDGSIRFSSDRIRITARLQAAQSGETVWADHFDRPRDDVFAIQDEVVSSIAAALDERVVTTGAGHARRKPAASWSAYDCLMQGRDLCNQHRELESVPFLKEAARRDPDSALAHAWLAIGQALTFAMTNRRDEIIQAEAAAVRALQCDDHDSMTDWAMAVVLTFGRRLPECQKHFARAILLNPANIQIRGDYANWLRYSGETEQALIEIDAALLRDPFAPMWFHAVRGGILFDRRDYQGTLQEIGRLPFQNVHVMMVQLAAHAYRNEAAEAATVLSSIYQLLPGVTLATAAAIHPYANMDHTNHLTEGLRLAGLSEG